MHRMRDRRRRLTVGLLAGSMFLAAAGWLSVHFRRSRWMSAGVHWLHASLTGANIAIAGGLIGAAAAIAIPYSVAYLQKKWARADAAESSRSAHDREFMLRRIENKWIKGVYEANQAGQAEVTLSLKVYEHANLAGPAGSSIESTSKNLIKILENLDDGILILGAPGAGKTMLLLRLAADLLRQARAQLERPIPVIFLLASWAERKTSLREWLVDELVRSYDVPRRTALRWVSANEILPLLDGLDEIDREHLPDCIDAINDFKRENGLTQFIVCSRSADYRDANHAVNTHAVHIQPLTRRQMSQFIKKDRLSEALRVMRPEGPLAELLQTPLGLRILALAYSKGGGIAAHSVPSQRNGLSDLFDIYLDRMFEQRAGRYDRMRTIHWLSWLSRSMQVHSQREFHLDRLSPSWLPTRRLRWAAAGMTAITVGLIAGLSDMMIYSFIYGASRGVGNGLAMIQFFTLFVALLQSGFIVGRRRQLRRAMVASAGGLVIGLSFWAEYSVKDAAFFGAFFAVAFIVFGGLIRLEPVEEFGWSWSRAGSRFCAGAGIGLMLGITYGNIYKLVPGYLPDVAFGAPFALGLGVFGALAGGLAPALSKAGNHPNGAISRSARLAVASAIISLSTAGVAFVVVFSSVRGISDGLGRGLRDALILGTAVWMLMGGIAFIRHLVLRILLAYKGFAPLSYIRFLDDASSRLFLYQAGSGFIFVHGLLQEHFARLE
jgi:eukaryotic-like serine/threonine-protein kinase